MYLKRIEIMGFKSFANKTKIEFNQNITGIVGPNGSGKSNISDAIMWVLGEQSVRTLRGSKMEDVIFSGTNKRKALGYAEATIVFDNAERLLPIDYAEVSITRKMFRSGESEFYINKTRCRLKDIRELFMDTGIGKDGYSIIGQGRIESILSNKPEDRRHIFEEAAGISKYKNKKNEAERNLEKTKTNLVRIDDIISEITRQESALKIESERAKSYLEIFEKLKYFDVNNILIQREKLTNSVKNNESKIEKNLEDLYILKLDHYNFKEKENKMKKNLFGLENDIEINQNTILSLTEKNERISSKIALNQEREKNYTEILKDSENISDNLLIDLEAYKNEKNINYNNIQINDDILRELYNQVERLKTDLNHKSALLNNLEKEKTTSDEKYMSTYENISEVESKINTTKSLNEEKKSRIAQIENRLKITTNNNIEIDNSISDAMEKNNLIINNLENISNKRNEIDLNLKSMSEQKDKLEQTIKNFQLEIKSESTKLTFLKNMSDNYEGYSKSVKLLLNGLKKDNLHQELIVGTVAEMFEVNREYELAITVALGSAAQNIIIKDSQESEKLIDYLIKNKYGRVTFLPLDSISGKKHELSKDMYNRYNIIGIGSDIIEFPKYLDNIFKFLLGRILIVKTISDAQRLSKELNYSRRIVTLNGESFNIGGSITGGNIYKTNTDIINRKPEIDELEKKIDNYKRKLIDEEAILEKTNFKIIEINKEKEKFDKIYEETNKEINKLKTKLEVLEKGKENNQIYINRYLEEIDSLNYSYNIDEQKLTNLFKDIDKLKEETKKILSGNKDYESNLKKYKEEIETLNKDLTSLKIDLREKELTKERLLSKKLDIEKNISDNTFKNSELKEKIENTKISISKLKNEVIDLTEELKTTDEELIFNNREIQNLKNRRNTIKIDIENFSENLSQISKKINRLEKQENKIFFDIEQSKSKIIYLDEKLERDYELNIDKAYELFDKNLEINVIKDNIEKYRERINSIGQVNILSISEYGEVKERLDFNIEQKNDLIESKNKIESIINDLEKEMKLTFVKSLEEISKSFNEIFSLLFNGGKATVELNDEKNVLTSGIEIKAQPPGKKLQSLSLFSGGEKSLTAVALLFSLLQQKPAPFCILDEIDAALDDANIKRYINYLKSFNNIQFIIITHRKITMEIANILYGVTMEEQGISNIISLELEEL